MTTQEIISTNTNRMAKLFEPYDPLLGIGSLVPRFEYRLTNISTPMFLPMHLQPLVQETLKFPSLEEYIRSNNGFNKSDFIELQKNLLQLRIREDFEFWCATCGYITPKTPEGQEGGVIHFVQNRPQRRLSAVYEYNRVNNIPNREVILKARQWGGSTVTDAHDIFTVLFHVMNWNISIIAHVEEAARNIRGMITTLAKHHPTDVYDIKMNNYEGSIKSKAIPDISDPKQFRTVISIGSMEKPDGMNSKDLKRVHFSEAGLWKKTIGKDPFHMAANIEASVPFIPHSSIVYESTAHGSGNFFHRKFTDAQKGVSGFNPFFVPWFEIERYTLPFESLDDKTRFAETLSEKDIELWEHGATLEGIQWHRQTRKDYDDVYMGQHFPTTPEEAFQTTGKRVFAPSYVTRNRRYCRPPAYIGDIFCENKNDNVRFEPVTGGLLWIWYLPETDINVSYRYIVQVDIGATSEHSSYSTIRVLDRIDLINAGGPEAIATWVGHLDVDLVIQKAINISYFYREALLSFESNPLDAEEARENEGDHTITLLDEVANTYPNLFTRTDPEKVRQGHPVKYGIHTNTKSKTDYVNLYKKILREGGYVEYDDRVNDQADTYERKENGRVKAMDGCHDDLVENTMMMLKVSELMPLPEIIEESKTKHTVKAINEASF